MEYFLEQTIATLRTVYKTVQSDINDLLKKAPQLPSLPYIIPQQNGENSIKYEANNINTKIAFSHLFTLLYGESLERLEPTDDLLHLFKWRPFPEIDDKKQIKFFCHSEILKVLNDLFEGATVRDRVIATDDLEDRLVKTAEFLHSEKLSYRIVVGLSGITLPEHLEVQNIKITTSTWGDRLDYYRTCSEQNFGFHKLSGFDHSQILTKAHSLLEYTCELDKSAKSRPGDIHNTRIANVIALLRLYNPFTIRTVFRSFEEVRPSDDRHIFPPGSNHFGDAKHEVEDVSALRIFIDENLDDSPLISGELGYIHERIRDLNEKGRSNEFRVFDYVSIIESILVGADQGEFTFRVPLYAAAILGKSPEQKKEIHGLLKKGYGTRSKIAHCSKLKDKHKFSNEELSQLTSFAHNILLLATTEGIETIRTKAQETLLN